MVFYLHRKLRLPAEFSRRFLSWFFLLDVNFFFLESTKTYRAFTKSFIVWRLFCNEPAGIVWLTEKLFVWWTPGGNGEGRWRQFRGRVCGSKTLLLLLHWVFYCVIHSPAWAKWGTGQYVNSNHMKMHLQPQLISVISIKKSNIWHNSHLIDRFWCRCYSGCQTSDGATT